MTGTGGRIAGKISPTTLRNRVGVIKVRTGPGTKVKVSPGHHIRGILLQLVFPRIHQQRSGMFSKSLPVIFLSRMPLLLGTQTSMVQLTLVRTPLMSFWTKGALGLWDPRMPSLPLNRQYGTPGSAWNGNRVTLS